jgi:hypothetical protein
MATVVQMGNERIQKSVRHGESMHGSHEKRNLDRVIKGKRKAMPRVQTASRRRRNETVRGAMSYRQQNIYIWFPFFFLFYVLDFLSMECISRA